MAIKPPSADELRRRGIDAETMQPITKTVTKRKRATKKPTTKRT